MAVVALFVFFLLRLAPGDPAAIIAGDLATAAKIQYGEIPNLEKQLKETEARLASQQQGGARFLKEEVTDEDIADAIERLASNERQMNEIEQTLTLALDMLAEEQKVKATVEADVVRVTR